MTERPRLLHWDWDTGSFTLCNHKSHFAGPDRHWGHTSSFGNDKDIGHASFTWFNEHHGQTTFTGLETQWARLLQLVLTATKDILLGLQASRPCLVQRMTGTEYKLHLLGLTSTKDTPCSWQARLLVQWFLHWDWQIHTVLWKKNIPSVFVYLSY